jgi:hypothetical protein
LYFIPGWPSKGKVCLGDPCVNIEHFNKSSTLDCGIPLSPHLRRNKDSLPRFEYRKCRIVKRYVDDYTENLASLSGTFVDNGVGNIKRGCAFVPAGGGGSR